MPASGPAKSGTLSPITGAPNRANRAGSPLALSTTPAQAGLSRAMTRSMIAVPPTATSPLSPPPMRRARPPARIRPSVAG